MLVAQTNSLHWMTALLVSDSLTRNANLLGGLVISPLIWVIAIFAVHITPLITTHEPPSRPFPHFKGDPIPGHYQTSAPPASDEGRRGLCWS